MATATRSAKRAPDATAPVVAWHALPVTTVAEKLGVDPHAGLAGVEVAQRVARYGPNLLRETPPKSPARMLFDQFADFMIVVLIAAAIVSGIVGDAKDTIVIVVIVVLNAVIGFIQEYRAERAMAALKQLAAANAVVCREGERSVVAAAEVVPGDVVLLEAGNKVPADLRLVEAALLKVDESLLTGESATVDKHCDPCAGADLPLGDRRSLAFKGTTVTHGRGRGIVVATGMSTELGRIAALLDAGETVRTPLQKRLATFGKRLGLGVLAICAIVFAIGLMRGETPVLMFLTAVSLAVAAIPEALPAVVTIALALGAAKMVREHALIRRLPAVETLGSVTYICSDKTGTLTQNRMRVEEVFAAGTLLRGGALPSPGEPWASLYRALALSNDAARSRHGKVVGDPTETALFTAALEAGYDKAALEKDSPRLAELPFDSQRMRMTTLHRHDAGFVAYTKGAPEAVLPLCTTEQDAIGAAPLARDAVLAAAMRMAGDGLRVLAVAQRRWPTLPSDHDAAAIESELTLVGLVGLLDPPRHEAREAVSLCKSAGIAPVMITGDHPATARTIARQLGIVGTDGAVVTGPELAAMPDDVFAERVADIRVYARVDPAQKIRIVEALQAKGEFVAMTGDGVNDAPALKRADIGVAMGKGGTDVAQEASSLVLLDDNFATIVAAVREGRRIYDNIRKFVRYVMTGNSGEIWTIFLAPFLGMPIPLLPIQILWVNLVTDGLPGLALAVEPAERGVMRRPPRPPRESIFARGMWQHIVWVGLTMGAVCLAVQASALRNGLAHWQTMVFTVLTFSQLGHALAVRSERESLFRQGLLSNRSLFATVLLTIALQLAIIYLPPLQPVFNTAPLSVAELAFCLAMSAVVFVAAEVEKLLIRRGLLYAETATASGRAAHGTGAHPAH